eukprot:UN01629
MLLFGIIAPLYSSIIHQFAVFDEVNQLCGLAPKVAIFSYSFGALLALSDLCLGFTCIALFLRPLYNLHVVTKNMRVMDPELQNSNENVNGINLLNVVKKQAKLAYISYISTILIVYSFAVNEALIAFAFMDSLVNVLCVYCTFDFEFNNSIFWYLCHCTGNKCLQRIFCFCCCCCCNNIDELRSKKPPIQLANTSSAELADQASAKTKSASSGHGNPSKSASPSDANTYTIR